jgi:hypothetical protein
MFWKDYQGWPMQGTRTVEEKCVNCSNTADHFVYVAPSGFQLGLIFLRKPLAGKRKYYLACPICGFMSRELTKEQACALKG